MADELFKIPTTTPVTETPKETVAVKPAEAKPQIFTAPPKQEPETDEVKPDELAMLKSRADLMGLKYSNNISAETLKQKIADKLEGKGEFAPQAEPEQAAPLGPAPTPVQTLGPAVTAPMASAAPVERIESLREKMIREQMFLVRVRITNLDPKKKDLPGEIFTVANEYLGNVKKYIPYGEFSDDGYHIPFCIYTQLKERTFVSIKTRKNKANNQLIIEHQDAKEFALDVLDPLTQAELNTLAAAQLASGMGA